MIRGRYAPPFRVLLDMPCVRIDLFIGKDSERVLNGFIPETGQCFTHDYLHRSAANSPCSRERLYLQSVVILFQERSGREFFYE